MATNKNQHFVPRCHLQPFTLNEGDAAINVFNLDHARFFPNAPVKNQCSGDYFYGKDELLETAIRKVEGAYGGVVREVRKPGQALLEEHRTILRRFWLLQYLRTEAASRRSVEMASDLDAVAGIEALSFKFDIRQAVQLAMRTYAESMIAIDDLKVCLIRNRTRVPFVTSDDPAVLTNRWYIEDPRISGRSFGLQASGLLALLPLTPRILCLAYDGDVYSVAHERGWADVRRDHDVRFLNQHQILNCFANLYLHDLAYADGLEAQVEAAKSRRLKTRHAVHIAVKDRVEGDFSRYRVVSPAEAQASGESALLHSETLHSKPTGWPAILRWRSPGAVYTNGTGIKYVRRAYAAEIQSHRDFWREPVR